SLQKARGLVPVESQIGISQVMNYHDLVFTSKFNDLVKEIQVHDGGGRIVRKTNDHQLRLGPRLLYGDLQVFQEVAVRPDRDRSDVPPGYDRRVQMDRVSGVGRENNVSRAYQHQHHLIQSSPNT